MLISEMNWGADSAENDPHLLQYFFDSSAFRRLSSRQKQMVIGRKGAGKSALRARLLTHFSAQADTFVVSIAPQYGTVRSILNDQDLKSSFGQEIFFQHTWLRQILTDCLVALGHSVKGKYSKESTEFARNLAKDLNRTSKDLLENITEVLSRVKAKVGELGDFGLDLEKELRNVADVDALEFHLLELTKSGVKFVILFDDLDQGWDNSTASNQLILGLLRAASILNGKSQNIFPIIFLREDVYSILMPLTQHADKYRNIEQIRWDKEALEKMLSSRINFNRVQNKAEPVIDLFKSIFPETIGTSNTLNWMVDRTLNRPRELLQLSRIYTENVDSEQPSDSALKASEVGYSTWKLADLCSEFSNQYPGLQDFFSTWRSNFPRALYHMKRADISELILSLLATSPINENWFNAIVEKTDIDAMMSVLYEIGLLGDYVSGGAGGGARAHYSFQEVHQPRFEEVQIHPCFRRALDTVERIRRPKGAANEALLNVNFPNNGVDDYLSDDDESEPEITK